MGLAEPLHTTLAMTTNLVPPFILPAAPAHVLTIEMAIQLCTHDSMCMINASVETAPTSTLKHNDGHIYCALSIHRLPPELQKPLNIRFVWHADLQMTPDTTADRINWSSWQQCYHKACPATGQSRSWWQHLWPNPQCTHSTITTQCQQRTSHSDASNWWVVWSPRSTAAGNKDKSTLHTHIRAKSPSTGHQQQVQCIPQLRLQCLTIKHYNHLQRYLTWHPTTVNQ